MISGATRGRGGRALANHVANAEANEVVIPGPSRGLVATTITAQVAELTRLGSHARTNQPIYHVHLDPPVDGNWSDLQREAYWERFEVEFGLERQPYAAQYHVKRGRTHEHREYLRVRPDGTAIRLDWDFPRREKLGRIAEFEAGQPFVAGKFNRRVIAELLKEGRADVAAAMIAAGLDSVERPVADLTPTQRMQQDRTGVRKGDVQAAAWRAWRASDSGTAFIFALSAEGLRLAQGDKVPVIARYRRGRARRRDTTRRQGSAAAPGDNQAMRPRPGGPAGGIATHDQRGPVAARVRGA